MKHWLSMRQFASTELNSLAIRAREIKGGSAVTALQGRVMTCFFFNSSLRTRTSFEAGMFKYGGKVISLIPGTDTWGFELRPGAVMDENKAEHISEAVRVVARYSDCLGVRSFAELKDRTVDAGEGVIQAFAEYSTVPVVNLESAMEHPCQALADMVTICEKLHQSRGKKFVLSWAPHIKPLPLAVPHSALLAAAYLGMDITVAHPPGYELEPGYLSHAKQVSSANNGQLTVSHNQAEACRDADVLYVKSWGAAKYYGDLAKQQENFRQNAAWQVTESHLSKKTKLMHCLPVRRNIVVSDGALDSANSIIIDQAENRLWAQVAILEMVLGGKTGT